MTGEIKKGFPDVPVLAVDPAEGMLRTFDRRTKDLGWENVERRALEGHNLTGILVMGFPLQLSSTQGYSHPFTYNYVFLVSMIFSANASVLHKAYPTTASPTLSPARCSTSPRTTTKSSKNYPA